MNRLGAIATDAASELQVLWHDGDTLGVDCAEVGVLEEGNNVSLGGLLKGGDGVCLEADGLHLVGNLTDEALEWELAEEQVGGLLVAADLTESDGTWAVTVWLLHASAGWRRLAGDLGGDLLARGLATGGLTGGLLGTSHDCRLFLGHRECDTPTCTADWRPHRKDPSMVFFIKLEMNDSDTCNPS